MKALSICSKSSFAKTSRLAISMAVAIACSTLAFAGPIHDAARKGDLKKVQSLIQADPTSVNSLDSHGDTPLHLASLHGEVAIAKVLVDAGANVNAKDNAGAFTPGDMWGVISSSNHQDPVGLLTVPGLITQQAGHGYTPVDMAIFSIHHKEMLEFLVSKGGDVNAQAASGATPLFWAVMRDQKDDAEFLLAHGANVNAATAYGDTILDMALHMQFGSMIQLIVDKGADVNAIDQSQHRPLTYAMSMDDHRWAQLLQKHGAHE
jgi:ankyrin repeat protein